MPQRSPHHRVRPAAAVAVLVAGLTLGVGVTPPVTGTASAAVVSAADSIAALNAERVANGLPGGIIENPEWSRACALHNAYMRLNGVMEHAEDPRKPGYTSEGHFGGTSSVLAGGPGWKGGVNPWASAPIHLMQLLGPRLSVTGASNASGHACMFTWPGYQGARSEVDVIYTVPGEGRRDVAPLEQAFESPFVPGDFVGLPEGTITGPHLYALADGPFGLEPSLHEGDNPPEGDMSVASASLIGPDGPVEVRTVDNTTARIGSYLPPGGIVIPVRPLRGNADYQASVTLVGPRAIPVTRSWSFHTAPLPNDSFLQLAWSRTPGTVKLRMQSRAPSTITVRTPRGKVRTRSYPGSSRPRGVKVSTIPGRWRVCLSSGGGASGFAARTGCLIISIDGERRIRRVVDTAADPGTRPPSR